LFWRLFSVIAYVTDKFKHNGTPNRRRNYIFVRKNCFYHLKKFIHIEIIGKLREFFNLKKTKLFAD